MIGIGRIILNFVLSGVIAVVLTFRLDAAQDDYPPCRTNSGPPGSVFKNMIALMEAPESFASVSLVPTPSYTNEFGTVGNKNIYATPARRFQNRIEVLGLGGARPENKTIVEFLDKSGATLQACFIEVVPFDPAIHNISNLKLGFCEFDEGTEIITVQVGEWKKIGFPEPFAAGLTSPKRVLDHTLEYGGQELILFGRSAGYAILVWIGAPTKDGNIRGICPVVVVDELGD